MTISFNFEDLDEARKQVQCLDSAIDLLRKSDWEWQRNCAKDLEVLKQSLEDEIWCFEDKFRLTGEGFMTGGSVDEDEDEQQESDDE